MSADATGRLSTCVYCLAVNGADPTSELRPAAYDLHSPAPRCATHWRFRCEKCERSAHFAAMAFCPDTTAFHCDSCATATETVAARWAGRDYYVRYRSPWTGRWNPALDRLEFEGRHPHQLTPTEPLFGVAEELVLHRPPARIGTDAGTGTDPSARIDEDRVSASWNENAASWDSGFDQDGDETRKHHSDGPMLKLLGDVSGLRVLDLGCGNGYLARKLARRAATVTGIDISEEMISLARLSERSEPLGIDYRTGAASRLDGVPDASLDAVVANYLLTSLPDCAGTLAEAHRVLRPGGRLVVVISHPCFSCGPRDWYYPAPDTPRAEEASGFRVDHYFRSGPSLLQWEGFTPIPFFHRPLREYWQLFTAAGLRVDSFEEPGITTDGPEALPPGRLRQATRIPLSCIFVLSRPH